MFCLERKVANERNFKLLTAKVFVPKLIQVHFSVLADPFQVDVVMFAEKFLSCNKVHFATTSAQTIQRQVTARQATAHNKRASVSQLSPERLDGHLIVRQIIDERR